jgi:hypothetical protein
MGEGKKARCASATAGSFLACSSLAVGVVDGYVRPRRRLSSVLVQGLVSCLSLRVNGAPRRLGRTMVYRWCLEMALVLHIAVLRLFCINLSFILILNVGDTILKKKSSSMFNSNELGLSHHRGTTVG